MELIFVAIGIASLAYVFLIFVEYGLTSFMWFWPLFALLNFTMFFMVRYVRKKFKEKKEIPLRPFVFFFASYGLSVVTLLTILAVIFSSAYTRVQNNLDYVIVVGTNLVDNKISKSLERRLDRAIEYARENPNTVFVLSGGRSEYGRNTEATVMYHYMINAGVPDKNLLLEFYSDSTQEKIGFSLMTIHQDHEQKLLAEKLRHPGKPFMRQTPKRDDIIVGVERPLSIGIITSDFNLLRAKEIAKKYGVMDACPMATKTDELMLVHLAVREAVALFKDRLIGNI